MGSFWDWVPTLATAATTIYGAKIAQDARDTSVKQANQATAAATDAIVQSNTESTAAYLKGIDEAKENAERLQGSASPGLVATQNIIGRGEDLTPIQQEGLETARRRTLDSLQGGSLRGSARATAETIKDVEGTMKNQYIAANRSRADTAASNLSGQYFNSGNNISNLNVEAGDVASTGLTNSGNAIGQSLDIQGQNIANNTINQATTRGSAIGDISATIAGQQKYLDTRDRDNRYDSETPSENG